MRISRRWPLFLLIYLVFDFSHPWAPGAFFFEADQLFVDGAVTLGKVIPPRPALADEPQPALRVDHPDRAVERARSSRGDMLRRFTSRIERRYSFRSSDRSSPPSSFPDAH